MKDDLIERVARAMRETLEPEWNDDDWRLFKNEARAATRIVMEECARVALKHDCARSIASAIRALAKGDGE